MKVDNSISFGQTFVQPSIKNLSKINQAKIKHSFGLGQIYPVDILLGGRPCGDLTLSIKRCNLWDYLVLNNEIPITNENMLFYIIAKGFEQFGEFLHGAKYPFEHYIIKNLDKKSAKDIAFEINDKITEYNRKHSKMFLS